VDYLRSLAQSIPDAAVGAIVAAVIAAFIALVVAWVNAWYAQRLARANAHRMYRAEMVAPVRKFAHGVAVALGPLMGQLNLGNPQWSAVRPQLSHVIDMEFRALWDEAKSFYPSSEQVVNSIHALNGVMHAFGLLPQRFSDEPTTSTARNEVIKQYGETIQRTAAAVQIAAEAFVYGGVALRREARRELRRADRRIEQLPGITAESVNRLRNRTLWSFQLGKLSIEFDTNSPGPPPRDTQPTTPKKPG